VRLALWALLALPALPPMQAPLWCRLPAPPTAPPRIRRLLIQGAVRARTCVSGSALEYAVELNGRLVGRTKYRH
jgi:hypothetical protein